MRLISGIAAAAVLAGGFAFAQDQEWPDLSGQSIRVAGVWTGDGQRDFETVLSAFEDLTGASVEFFSTGDDIATIVGTQIEGGNPPDIAMLPQPGLLVEFARRGALHSIEDFAVSWSMPTSPCVNSAPLTGSLRRLAEGRQQVAPLVQR